MKAMNRLLLLPALLIASGALTVNALAKNQPNVILILADDLGYGDLGCYGHPKFKTPNLDRMAAHGARLTQFNTPLPFCAPTRASLMTGRYPFRCGLSENPAPDGGPERDQMHLPESEITLAQLFKKAGYATSIVGKWHLGHARPEWLPTHRGFDEYLGIPYSNDMRPVQLFEGDKPGEYPVVQANLTRRYTERAVSFIERNRSKPFFLYLPHAMPHKPLAASEAYYKKSGNGLYADVMAELDWGIGQLLAKLDELKLSDKTLIVFTSDNGAWFGGSTAGLRGMKGSTYEGGYRVPCIARWPGVIPKGVVSDAPAQMMDLFATALKAADIKAPSDRTIDGRDIMPVFKGTGKSPHAVTYGQNGPSLSWVCDGQWKLHVLPPKDGMAKLYKPGQRWIDPRAPDGVTIIAPYEQYQPSEHPGLTTGAAPVRMQLFNLKSDAGEQTDVASKHPDIVARLKKSFDAFNKQVPEPAPKAAKK